MPAPANITLADHVPTNHVFKPIAHSGDNMIHETVEMTIGAAERQLILGLSRANGSRATDHVVVRLNCPFEQTIDGTVSVRDVARFEAKFILPSSMTTTERTMFQKLVANAFDNSVIIGYVTNREPVY